MTERHKSLSAVAAIIIQDGAILLQKRQNTGYKDGYYDLGASGHVEKDESFKQAMQREVFEELGISVKLSDLVFKTLIHKHDAVSGKDYDYVFFLVTDYVGVPTIMEPLKNGELIWCQLDELPSLLIEDIRIAIENYLNDIHYTEIGWNYHQ